MVGKGNASVLKAGRKTLMVDALKMWMNAGDPLILAQDNLLSGALTHQAALDVAHVHKVTLATDSFAMTSMSA